MYAVKFSMPSKFPLSRRYSKSLSELRSGSDIYVFEIIIRILQKKQLMSFEITLNRERKYCSSYDLLRSQIWFDIQHIAVHQILLNTLVAVHRIAKINRINKLYRLHPFWLTIIIFRPWRTRVKRWIHYHL